MKHHLQLSGAEAYGRLQEARLRRAVGVWNNALAAGQVGVAQTRLMARIAANPRIAADVLHDGVWQLLVDAMDLSYIEFECRALTFEALADPIGAAERPNETGNDARRSSSSSRMGAGACMPRSTTSEGPNSSRSSPGTSTESSTALEGSDWPPRRGQRRCHQALSYRSPTTLRRPPRDGPGSRSLPTRHQAPTADGQLHSRPGQPPRPLPIMT